MANEKSSNVTSDSEDIADQAMSEVELSDEATSDEVTLVEDTADSDDVSEPVEADGFDDAESDGPESDDPENFEPSDEDDEADADDAEADDPADDAELAAEDIVEPDDVSEPAVIETRVIEKRAGFFPTVLGGIVAAGIGVGASETGLLDGILPGSAPEPNAFEVEARAALTALEEQVAGAATQADVDALAETAANAGQTDALQAQMSELGARLDGFDARLNDLEKRPISEGVSGAAIAAYERELAAMQESVAAQRAEIENIAAEAANKEAEASQMAQATLARAALSRVISAIESGSAFDGALSEFASVSGLDIPDALSAVAGDGLPPLSELQRDFPEAARAALAASRSAEGATGDGSGGGLGSFFARQLGARSVTPREGSDPDAVLSRAEAAVRDGRLTDALAEMETLPEAGRTAAAAWVEAAGNRKDAQAAAEALSVRLDQN